MKTFHCPIDDRELVPQSEMFGSFWKCPTCHKEFTWDRGLPRNQQGERAVKR